MRRTTIVCLALALSACGTARVVSRTQTGGIIALEGDRQKAMEDANHIMTDQCRGPYTVVSEGEQVIGTETEHKEQSYVTKDGRVVNSGGAQTLNTTEWRVQYECGAVAGAPPPPAPYQPPPGTIVVPSQTNPPQ
jgi:hypothetical protein